MALLMMAALSDAEIARLKTLIERDPAEVIASYRKLGEGRAASVVPWAAARLDRSSREDAGVMIFFGFVRTDEARAATAAWLDRRFSKTRWGKDCVTVPRDLDALARDAIVSAAALSDADHVASLVCGSDDAITLRAAELVRDPKPYAALWRRMLGRSNPLVKELAERLLGIEHHH